MSRPRFAFSLAIGVVLTIVVPLHADTVKLTGRPEFRGVSVRGYGRDRLTFRGVSGEYLRKPLAQVEWVAIDRLPELTAAESAFAAGDWVKAAGSYENALEDADQRWLRDLIRVRLLTACDRGERFDRAVALFTQLAATDPEAARHHVPRHPASVGSETNGQAMETLEAALAADPSPATVPRLRSLLLELALYEDIEPLPAAIVHRTTTRPASASQPVTDPGDRLGILPEPPEQPTEVVIAAAPLRLPAHSFVLDAAQAALGSGEHRRATRLVERAMPYVARSERGPWLLLLGRCRIEAGRYAEGAADLLDLSLGDSDPAVATLALYYVGLAHERMGQRDIAAKLYRELLERPDAPEDTRAEARQGLERIQRRQAGDETPGTTKPSQ